MLFNKDNKTIPHFIMGTIEELLENLNTKKTKEVLSSLERKKL